MGILDRLRADDEEDEDEEVSDSPKDGWTTAHYTVKHSSPESRGGWTPLENFKGLSYPMSEREFRANYPDREPGKYRLWAVDEDDIHHPPKDDENAWMFEEKPQDEGEDKRDDVRQLERKVDRVMAKLEDEDDGEEAQTIQDPKEALEFTKANLALEALQSDAFVEQFGDRIALSMFDAQPGGEGSSVAFDDYRSHPLSATLYEMFQNPERMEQMGRAFGSGAGSFLEGFTNGSGDGAAFSMDSGEDETEAEPDESEGTDWQPRDIDGGPATAEDLENAESDTAERIAKARASAEEAAEAEAEAEPDPADGLTAEVGDEAAAEVEDSPADPIDAEPGDLGPEPVDAGTEPGRCQAITNDGDRCKNEAVEGSNYCRIESHGPDQDGDGDDLDDGGDEPDEGADTDSDESAAVPSSDEPDPKEVVEAL